MMAAAPARSWARCSIPWCVGPSCNLYLMVRGGYFTRRAWAGRQIAFALSEPRGLKAQVPNAGRDGTRTHVALLPVPTFPILTGRAGPTTERKFYKFPKLRLPGTEFSSSFNPGPPREFSLTETPRY